MIDLEDLFFNIWEQVTANSLLCSGSIRHRALAAVPMNLNNGQFAGLKALVKKKASGKRAA